MDFIHGLKDRTVFIVGSCKNAGKTTFLNYAMSRLRGGRALGALSVGVDGEKEDSIFLTAKPQVHADRGDLLLCAETALANTDLHYEILNVYPFRTAIGRPVLLRALRAGRAEISGPENNSQLAEILADMRRHGAGTIFVDGAVDRITQAAEGEKASFVYVARIEPDNIDSAAAAMKLLWSAAGIPLWKPDTRAQEPVFFVEGALTREKLPQKAEDGGTLVAEDPTKIFLSWREWQALNNRFRVLFRRKPDLAAFIVNLYNINRTDFERKLGSPDLAGRITYNPYQLAAAQAKDTNRAP
ncbi:MAG TPA: hypothetical protein PKI19_13110 [Elusimicrobiales bacterium]|nr:hypothetical protein [Elusimicrobiales bacterium]